MDNKKNPLVAKLVITVGVSLMVAALAYVGVSVSEDDVAEVVQAATARECSTHTIPGTTYCLPAYCERFPSFCRECAEPPCGEPVGLVCCDFGCVAVETYSECMGDLYWCEWGYQGVDSAGKPYVICYDE